MSTDYLPLKNIPARDLFDGRLEKFNIREDRTCTTATQRGLTDGRNYVSVDINDAGFAYCFSSHSPDALIKAIAAAFDTVIYHEAKDDAFYVELVKFLRSEPNRICLGSVGKKHAEIAKTLVEKDPTLLLFENKGRLLREMDTIYERDHMVTVTLSPENVAILKRVIPLPSETYLTPGRMTRVRLHRHDCHDDLPIA